MIPVCLLGTKVKFNSSPLAGQWRTHSWGAMVQYLRGALSYLLIVVITALVFYNSLNADFTFDDHSAILSNRYVHTNETDWWSLFQVDYWGTPIQSEHSHKSYRPLTSLSFRLDNLLWGLQPFYYHLTNVLLHILVTLSLFHFMLNLTSDHGISLLMTLLFSVHPLKSEACTSIVGRAELLSTLLYLKTLNCYFKKWYLLFAIGTILATISKEQGLTVSCVCIILELLNMYFHYRSLRVFGFLTRLVKVVKDECFRRVILLTVFTSVLLAARFIIMGSKMPVFTKFDNPASFAQFPTRQLTFNYLLPLNALLILYPKSLCADWTMNSIPLIEDWHDERNLQTLAFYLVCLGLIVRAVIQLHSTSKDDSYMRKISLALSLSLTIIPFIPASNLLFPVGFVLAERVLYTPSVGYCCLLAIGFIRIRQFFNSKIVNFVLYLLATFSIIAYSARTVIRNQDWENDFTLFQAGLAVNPNNAKLYNNIGHYYERQQQYEKAIDYFQQAAAKDEHDIGSELNIARALIQLPGRIEQAEELLWKIKPKIRNSANRNRIVPNYLNLWINLARVISMNDSRLGEAEKLYWEVISMRNDFIDAYINLGEIYFRRRKYDTAIETYRLALDRTEFKNDLKAADLHYNIAIAKTLQLNNEKQTAASKSDIEKAVVLAEIAESFTKAIEINANHKEALVNLAILVQKPEFQQLDNRTQYREFVLKALRAYTKNEEREVIEFNIAITLIDLDGQSNRLEAINHLRNAIKIKPSFRSALYNLAILYYEFKDYKSSLQYLQQLSGYHSTYTKAFLLMADVYTKLLELDNAEQIYLKVLESDSSNNEALHGLYRVYKFSNQTQKFQKYASRLANNSRSS